jgi:hypothetical protein
MATAYRIRVAGRLLAVLAAGLWFVVLLASGASAAPTTRGPAAPATSRACPSASTCATIPSECPAGTTCPEVILAPTVGIGTNQWVFVTAEHFPPGDSIYVYYCSNKLTLSQADPDCMLEATPEIPVPQVVLTASPRGTASISFATEADADDGNAPLVGKEPGTQTTGSFFCDDLTNPCSIDITDPALGSTGQSFVLNPDNAVAVPLSFAKPSSGCPLATFVSTSSEFGIDRILPIASEFDCVGTTPAIAINTDVDSLQAVTSMVVGASQVAFIDEPNAPDVEAELAHLNVGGKPGYSLIPVALSAQVMGFRATTSTVSGNRIFPQNTFSLTPTMAAGLLTNYYASPEGADVVDCGKAFGGQCSLLTALNTLGGFRPAGSFGAYVRSDTSSSTGELFNWLCSAPIVPFDLGHQQVTEELTAAQVLLSGLQAGKADETSCPDTDQFPPLTGTFAWAAVNTPSQQALKLTAFVPPPNASISPVAAFAPMNWSWADYYGLLPAALQNAAGNFVLPSPASLDAAVASATLNANGTLSPDFTTTSPDAYPLPDLWYAVVPTNPATAPGAIADRTLVDDVLDIAGGPETADLPAGFVPLPASIYDTGLADVSNDIHVPATSTTTTTTTTATTTATSSPASPTSTTTPYAGVPTTTTFNAPPTTAPKVTATTSARATTTTSPERTPTTRAFEVTAFSLPGRSDAWLAPAFVSVVALALLLGPGLLFRTRRRLEGGT